MLKFYFMKISIIYTVFFLKELVRKGIPHPFRGLAWQLLLNVHSSPHKQMYVEYMRESSPSERYIRRDIARTFPDHEFFKEKDGVGQESLFNVMKVKKSEIVTFFRNLRHS